MYKLLQLRVLTLVASFLLLVGCSLGETNIPVVVVENPCPTCPPIIPEPTSTPAETPEPTLPPEPRTLTICLGAEPDTLFFYASNMLVTNTVWDAIYDGPIDLLSYGYQPVIINKLPSLADGDARIDSITVQSGDLVVDDTGEVKSLAEGDRIRPYGCSQSNCAVIFDGNPLEMGQLSADFTLLGDLRWSDGESLTSADAVFSFKVAQQCESYLDGCTNHSLVEQTTDFIALDELTTRWIGIPGYMDPNYMANFFHPLPGHQLQNMPVLKMVEAEATARLPMGWGPYLIERWDIGQEIRMRANPYYFRVEEDLPRFDNLVFRFTGEDPIFNISEILGGDCDLVEQDAGLEVVLNLLIGMDQVGLLQAHTVNGNVLEHFDFNLLHASYDDGYQAGSDRPDLFGDTRTRQAIAMCLDRQKVINQGIYRLSDYERYYLEDGNRYYVDITTGEVPNSYIPADHPLYNPAIESYEFSAEKGTALLEQVGWIDHDQDSSTPRQAQSVPNVPDGTLLEFNYSTTGSDLRRQVAQILAESLSGCGIKVNIQYWNSSDFFELPTSPVFNRNYDVVEFASLMGVIPPCERFLSENIPGDPEFINSDGSQRFPQGWEGENNSGYSSEEFDAACTAALVALPGQPEFALNHLLAQEIFARDLPVIPLFQRLKVTAAQADLCGYQMDPAANSDTWGIEGFGYGEECQE